MKSIYRKAVENVAAALVQVEKSGGLVVTSTTPNEVAATIIESSGLIPELEKFTASELEGIASLISHASSDEKFYDWEMPTLVGYTSAEMADLAKRIKHLAESR